MIDLINAGYSYGGGSIFENVDLQIAKGSFHFLTGPSGSGKTTLLKLCYQELMPTSGTIKIFGKDVHAMNRDDTALLRRRIGVVHQDCQFLDHLSVAENILMPAQVSGRNLQSEHGNLGQLLKWINLFEQRDALPPQLSGGERQRAALARAVILTPEIIIADEPTGNLDWDMASKLLELLVELNKSGRTVLFATHDMNLIRASRQLVSARVLRIQSKQVLVAGAEL